MRIAAAMLADYAEQREGLLFVLAGGVRVVYPPSLPANLPVSLAMLVEADRSEMDKGRLDIDVKVTVRRKGRKASSGYGARILATAKDSAGATAQLSVPVTVDLRGVVISAEGPHLVTVELDGKTAQRLPFDVEIRSTPVLPPGMELPEDLVDRS